VTHQELPVPDYDHLPLATLRDRIRSLTEEQLAVLVAHEEEHGARLPVLEAFRTRREQLAAGSPRSGGDPAGAQPEHAPAPEGPPAPVSDAPPVNPPSHGDPTNPAQPRT
jgi:hypothetical protein